MRIILVTIFCCCLLKVSLSQKGPDNITCPTDLYFNSQGEIDSFPRTFPLCTDITGYLTIAEHSGGEITNVDSLYPLTSIGLDLNITSNTQITDLSGLHNLQSIGGDIVISGNVLLPNLSGLDHILIVRDLKIENNPLLATLEGLHHLQEARHIQFTNVKNINRLDELRIVSGDFIIKNTHGDIFEFPMLLDTIKGKLTFLETDFPDSLSNPLPLKSVGGLELNRTNITNLSAFSNLDEIKGDVTISRNRYLKSLSGPENLSNLTGDIFVENNRALLDLLLFEQLNDLKGNITISGNDKLVALTGLSSLTEIDGNLKIFNNDLISDLSGLHQLTHIGGNLEIGSQENLVDLSGLEGLDSIGGSLLLTNNLNLKDFKGIENITHIPGILRIDDCAATDFSSLTQLVSIGDTLDLSSNSFLSLDGLQSLVSIGQISLRNNSGLQNIDALNHLSDLSGGIRIYYCHQLSHLPFLDKIDTIYGDLIIEQCAGLTNLFGFDSIKVIGGSLILAYIDRINSLQGLAQLRSIGNQMIITGTGFVSLEALSDLQDIYGLAANNGPVVQIVNNQALKECTLPPLCEMIAENQEILLKDNLRGCNNIEQLEFHCNTPIDCGRYNIALYNQNIIDSFNFYFPGCGIIPGNLVITEQEPGQVTRLDSLYRIQAIGGKMTVNNIHSLKSLHGLENLKLVGAGIYLTTNDSLEDISALAEVDLDKLGKINYAEFQLSMMDNKNLSFCSYPFMCDLLSRPELSVNVFRNKPYCSTQSQIRSLCDYPVTCSLDTIFETGDLLGFPIKYPSCTTLEGGLVILAGVFDLTPLTQLEHINGEIYLDGGNNVTSLAGLHNIKSIAGPITLKNQLWLNDISALSNIDPESIQAAEGNYKIIFDNNRYLSACAVHPVCHTLVANPDEVLLNNNLPGCDSPDEVLAQCLVGTEPEKHPLGIKVYPNPTDGLLYFSEVVDHAYVYSMEGKLLKKEQVVSQMDIALLYEGIVVLKMVHEGAIQVQKIMIMK